MNPKGVKRVIGQMATALEVIIAGVGNCLQAEEESDGDAEWTMLTQDFSTFHMDLKELWFSRKGLATRTKVLCNSSSRSDA